MHETSHADLASAAPLKAEMRELAEKLNTSCDLQITTCELKTKSTSLTLKSRVRNQKRKLGIKSAS